MLGRHVYRLRPDSFGIWQVLKEGERDVRGSSRSRGKALQLAERLAAADEPSRLLVEDEHGTLVAERLFGKDDAATLDEELSRGRK